jgi:hypothetical protein
VLHISPSESSISSSGTSLLINTSSAPCVCM